METKWASGILRNTPANMAAAFLASSTTILSRDLIQSLGKELLLNHEELAAELGYLPRCTDGLYRWCSSPGSTIFVLVAVLSNLGRADCISKIEQYLMMHAMKLFIKVEETTTQGSPHATRPKFYQVTTSCEFSLAQALENFLGGDLVHYEIVGPGPWVTWNTLAKDLKGKQLTLLYHNEPVPGTVTALYGSSGTGTVINQSVIEQNIPVIVGTTSNDETQVKVFDHNQIDSLKYAPESSSLVTTSNNLTPFESLDHELPEALTKTSNVLSFDSQNYKMTLGCQSTEIKVPIAGHNNAFQYFQVVKDIPDKDIDIIDGVSDYHYNMTVEENPFQVLNNCPYLTRMDEAETINPSNAQRDALKTDQNSLSQTTPYPFTQTSQAMTLQSTQNQDLQYECTMKQSNLNNLNCDIMMATPHISHAQNSLDYQMVQKTMDTPKYKGMARPDNRSSQLEAADIDNVMNADDTERHFSEMNMDVPETALAASSFFTQNRQEQQINNSSCSQTVDYIPQACKQNVKAEAHPHNLDCITTSLQHQSSEFVITQSQKRHRLDGVTNSSSTPLEQHIIPQAQQQTFVENFEFICNAPQPQFFDKISECNCDTQPGFQQKQLRELSLMNTSLNQQGSTVVHSEEQASFMIVTNARGEQFVAVLKPPSVGLGSTSSMPTLMRLHSVDSNSQSPSAKLPNIEFTVRLPQSDLNTSANKPQVFSNLINQSRNASDTSSFGISAASINNGTAFPNTGVTLSNSSSAFHNNRVTLTNIGATFPNSGVTLPNSGTAFPNSGITFANSGAAFPNTEVTLSNSGAIFHNSGVILSNNGAMFPNSGVTLSNYGATFPNSRVTLPNSDTAFPNSGAIPPSGGAAFHNSRVTFSNSGATFRNNDVKAFTSHATFANKSATLNNRDVNLSNGSVRLSSNPTSFQRSGRGLTTTAEVHHKNLVGTDLPFRYIGASVNSSSGSSRNGSFNGDINMDEEGYNCIDNGHSPRDKSQPIRQWSSPATPKRAGLSLESELLQIEGWCPQENGDTIQTTMATCRSQDGSFILWKSRRYNKFVITVNHLNKAFHFLVEEVKHENRERTVYYLFEGGFRSESLLDLLQHYRQNSIRISMQSKSGTKTHIEHIMLRYPIKSKVKRKNSSRPS